MEIVKLNEGRTVQAPCTPGHMGHPADCRTAKPNRWGHPVHREPAPQYEVHAPKGQTFKDYAGTHSMLAYSIKEAREIAASETEPCTEAECDVCEES